MDIKSFNFEPILNKIKEDPEAGYTDLVNVSRSEFYFRARNIVKDSAVAEDIVQNAYIKIYQSIDSLTDPKGFLGWAYTIIRNECYAYFRANNIAIDPETKVKVFSYDAFENFDLADERIDYQPELKFDDEEKKRIVHSILDELTPIKRQVIMMRYYDEMKISEIAKELGINENTIKTRIADAKKEIEEKVIELDKKHSIKLYSITPFAFFLWLLRGCKNSKVASTPLEQAKSKEIVARIFKDSSNAAAVGTFASTAGAYAATSAAATKKVSAASGATKAAPAAIGLTAKLAAIPTAVKVAVVAGIVILGVGTGVAISNMSEEKINPEPIIETGEKAKQTEQVISNDTTKNKETTEDKKEETSVEELVDEEIELTEKEDEQAQEQEKEEDIPEEPEEPDEPDEPEEPDDPDEPETTYNAIENSNGDIVITASEVSEAFERLVTIDEDDWDRISFYNGGILYGTIFPSNLEGHVTLSDDKKTLTISNTIILYSGIPNGTYAMTSRSKTFDDEVVIGNNITLTKACAECPAITYSQDETHNLIITSTEEYISSFIENKSSVSNNYLYIDISDSLYGISYSDFTKKSDTELVLSIDILKNHLSSDGEYDMFIENYGYANSSRQSVSIEGISSDDPEEEDKPVDISELNTSKTLVFNGVEYNIIDIDVENNAATVTRSYLSEDSKTGFSNVVGTHGSAYEGSLCQQYMNDYYNSLPDDIKSAIIPVTIPGKSLGLLYDDANEQYIEQDDIENQYVYPYSDAITAHDDGTISIRASGYAVPEGYDISSMAHDGDPEFYYWTSVSWGAISDEEGGVRPMPTGTIAVVGTYYPENWEYLRASVDGITDGTKECYNRPTFKIGLDNVYQSQVEDKPY